MTDDFPETVQLQQERVRREHREEQANVDTSSLQRRVPNHVGTTL